MSDNDRTEMYIFHVTEDLDAEPDEQKCDACRYRCTHRFVLAGKQDVAEQMVTGELEGDDGYNGFCGDCMIGILRGGIGPMDMGHPDGGHTIYKTATQ